MSEFWDRVTSLFGAARALDPHLRDSFLKMACEGDNNLRTEVEALLSSDTGDDGFLEDTQWAGLGKALVESSITPGQVLKDRYRVEEELATGGQALVYRANDDLLRRPVVIKLMRVEGRWNRSLKSRFEQEMQALAHIDHPGVVGILDVGQLEDGSPFLVIQHIPGISLREALLQGPMSGPRVAAILRQIGGALQAAHSAGIAHQDLKPENVMLQRREGGAETVRLIDFGIAKIDASKNERSITTVMIAGTVRYMAPEQFDGKNSMASDIYSLALVACEMLCGHPDARALPKETGPETRAALEEALAFKPDDRPADVQAWCERLAETLGGGRKQQFRRIVAAIVLSAILAIGAAAAMRWFHNNSGEAVQSVEKASVTQFFIRPPENTTFPAFRGGINGGNLPALSPDGHKLAVALAEPSGRSMLWVQHLDSTNAQALAGTENSAFPFWSPDSSSIGFFSEGKLKRVAATGGSVQVICDAALPRGGTWNKHGVILFAAGRHAIYKVAAAGGDPAPVLKLDEAHGETSQRWPHFLPDDQHFVYWSPGTGSDHSEIHLASLASPDSRLLFLTDSNAVYDPNGYLIFIRQNKLLAQPFDIARLQTRGDAFRIADEIGYSPDGTLGEFSVSGNGILAYRKGGTTQTQLAWHGRDGKRIGPAVAADKEYLQVNLSADEKQAVVHVADEGIDRKPEIWLIDLLRGVPSRFTFGSRDSDPIWSPDGQRIVFTSRRNLQANLYWKATNGSGSEDLLLDARAPTTASDWSRDGKYVVYLSGPGPGQQDIYALHLPDKQTIPVLKTKFNKDGARFSPDGRWLAFHSNPTGIMEVYVTTFPASERIWQISNGGGAQARWRGDGKELFYLTLDGKLMSVDLAGGAELDPRVAKMLFQSRVPVQHQIDQYAVSADGRRFLMINPAGNPESIPITVVLNWNGIGNY